MRVAFHPSLLLGLILCLTSVANAQDSWTDEQQTVIAAVEQLSESTAPDGAGADAYGVMLADDFSRWTVGSQETQYKDSWIEGIREWFDDGWRVSKRESQFLQIDIRDRFAFTRRNVTEHYLGPDGETSSSNAALAEVWIQSDNGWLLQYVSVHPIPTP